MIVAGSQQALDLAACVLLNSGYAAWIEDPGYLGARTALLGAGAQLIPVPMAPGGFDLTAAQARCADARLAYITPSHQFPLGGTMSLGVGWRYSNGLTRCGHGSWKMTMTANFAIRADRWLWRSRDSTSMAAYSISAH